MSRSASPSGPATSTRRPNVLVFFTDQQRWDTTGPHGNPLGLTPVLDRLAAEGVSVDRSFTCQPVCAPSRASLQTGQYPTTTGVFRNGLALSRDAPSLARSFRDAGYATGYIDAGTLPVATAARRDGAGPRSPRRSRPRRPCPRTPSRPVGQQLLAHATDSAGHRRAGAPGRRLTGIPQRQHLPSYRRRRTTRVRLRHVRQSPFACPRRLRKERERA
ncbi:sulfatase-like hydrolase/transferase [Streptomyces sp. NPDC007875]|uniref:sulfatase-like hydrolase/transferase n=1 Tax=Streptomyces sp. NPDC007875 TaxID=3364783 RepID=UPI0036748BF7